MSGTSQFMDSNLIVNASITIRDRCGVKYLANDTGNIEFSIGSAGPPIRLIFELSALRHFFEQAGNALGDVAVSIVRRDHVETSQAQEHGIATSSHLLPSDTDWTEHKILVADLSSLNSDVARYVLRQLDVDAGQAEPVSTTYEDDFGQRLIAAGQQLRYRAAQREVQASEAAPAIEGEATQQEVTPDLEPASDREDGP